MFAKSCLIGVFAFSLGALAQQASAPFKVCGQSLKLELADTPALRAQGLMHRDPLAKGTGMLFKFPAPEPLSFWMKNVRMDLDIGYFDERGKLLNVHTMKAESPLLRAEKLKTYPSQGLALYAVEVPAGFYASVALKICRLEPLPGPSLQ